jgi:hypothetical protein
MRSITNYIDLNWKTEDKFNIGSKYQPPVYHNVDITGISVQRASCSSCYLLYTRSFSITYYYAMLFVSSILIEWRLHFHSINSTVDVIWETTQVQRKLKDLNFSFFCAQIKLLTFISSISKKKSWCTWLLWLLIVLFLTTWEIISLYMRSITNYIDLNWKTEDKFNIGSKYQPPVYHNVDNTECCLYRRFWLDDVYIFIASIPRLMSSEKRRKRRRKPYINKM